MKFSSVDQSKGGNSYDFDIHIPVKQNLCA